MTAVVLSVAGVTALLILAGALVAVTVQARSTPGPALTGRTLVVQTRDGQTIRGLLVAQHADRLTLREALYERTESEGGSIEIGGLAHIPVPIIAWMQELEG